MNGLGCWPVTHMSNVLGTINPIRQIVELANAVDARVLLDAAQSIPHQSVDVQELGVDFLAFQRAQDVWPIGCWCFIWSRATPRRDAPFPGWWQHD